MRSSEEGAATAEAAIILSAFTLLIFGLVQFALVFWTWNTMMLGLEEGGRYAMVYNGYPGTITSGPTANNPPGCADTLANCAVARANSTLSSYPSLIVTVSCTAGPASCTSVSTAMTLQGTFTYNFLGSGSLPGSITVTKQVTVPLT
jgi:Flp pilus assembly protein TadG